MNKLITKLSLLALMFTFTISNAQKNVTLTIQHKLGTSAFAFNAVAQNNLAKNFKITRMDYYISGIILIHDGGTLTPVPNKYILAKGNANVISNLGSFNVTNVEGIKFSIGVNAPINNADPSLQPVGSPLAPQNPSMHWGWSSGYRFVALEGKAGSNFTTTFQMHGLGNANYFQQTIMAAGVNSGSSDVTINLDADYTQALKNIDVSLGPIDHGVNATDLVVLQNMRDFVFGPGAGLTGIADASSNDYAISLVPNPTSGKFVVDFDSQSNKNTQVVVTDIFGKTLTQIDLNANNEIDLTGFAKGIYVLKFQSENTPFAVRKIMLD